MEQVTGIEHFIKLYKRGRSRQVESPSTWYCEVKHIINDRFSLTCSTCNYWFKCYNMFMMRFMK